MRVDDARPNYDVMGHPDLLANEQRQDNNIVAIHDKNVKYLLTTQITTKIHSNIKSSSVLKNTLIFHPQSYNYYCMYSSVKN